MKDMLTSLGSSRRTTAPERITVMAVSLWSMGGGVRGGVYGHWDGLSARVLDQGDVPGSDDFWDLLGEVVMKRLTLSAADAGVIFLN